MAQLSTFVSPAKFRARVRHHGFGRLVYKMSERLGVPNGASFNLVRVSKAVVSPNAMLSRRMASQASTPWSDALPRDLAYRIFKPGELPGAKETAQSCARHAERIKPQIEKLIGQTFAVDLLDPGGPVSLDSNYIASDLDLVPGLLDFALSGPNIEAATGYLGEIPVLGGITLYASLPNASAEGSQLYHCDQVDKRMFKVLVAVNDIADEQGPFTFLEGIATAKVRRTLGALTKRYKDEDLFKVVDPKQQIPIKGPAGTALFIDTHHCLHFGSRGNTKTRLLLELLYQSRFAQESRWQLANQMYDRSRYMTNKLHRQVLGLE